MIRLSIVLCLLGCAGCGLLPSDECRIDPAGQLAASPGHAGDAAAVAYESLDDLLVRIVDDVPGFGGFYFSGLDLTGELNIFLVEPDQELAEAARAPLAKIFQRTEFLTSPVVPRQGQYDYRQLIDWSIIVSRLTAPHGGWTLFDIDESKNRMVFGIPTQGAIDKIRVDIEQSEVPAGAVVLMLFAGVEMASDC